jgi:RNA polymerase sigma factor (TIGR02999 family)
MSSVTAPPPSPLRGLPVTGAHELLPLVYDELRRMAGYRMALEAPGHTLQPTALVHEVWLRLAGGGGVQFEDRSQFFAAAAEAMRRILVESARRRRALKRGGGADHTELEEFDLPLLTPIDELLAVDEALTALAQVDAIAAELVKLRYFVGLTMDEAAAALKLSLRATERLWTFARAWLRRQMEASRA